ncbi:MAG: tRNA lysidine(34) synthetase TilS [Azoarcus sp.]|jgi:tRNA(Ile)-lysidine synthase|nr:tRNA lysidine(34) synthetase TilS [Azoarcus sp.]
MRTGALPAVVAVTDAVAATLAATGVDSRHRLCCALSGGVDSVVLLDALHTLRPRFQYALEAAHVHHGLNPAADEWQDFCGGLCERRSISLRVFKVEVPRTHSGGLEEAARIARHAALSRVACDWLVLGHHLDDQAETVLFRLLRGAGVQGAAAMATIEPPDAAGRAGRLRPLLAVSREEVLAYAREKNLDWIDDDSNNDLRFTRNDLRHRILPAIETRFPAARLTLARAATHFREAAGLLDELARADADAATCESGEEGRIFNRAFLLSLSPARLANLFRWELKRLGAMPPTTARLAEALRQLRTASGPLCLPLGDTVCHSRRGRVWLIARNEKQNERIGNSIANRGK